ncbi:GNAT family N-acetyltransferase [Cognataquiflexum rubidum]|uniref:GNAT family N-acetyltransferase n=1 Tax=Cognataquiflexum rubidum TaxID=2922273 RepID=UPI001F145644|nr:GNAT family N-acetyltransferase [Cognataquiflexum rubidum]MCH6236326.1 GNAT family N-acetyltransferase [Cognataquiflexum rubidum]
MVQIIDYTPDLKPHFEKINREWVEKYFTLEPFDLEQLGNPQEVILNKGGAILFAKDGEEIIGTVGLAKSTDDTYEMIKMAVIPKAQGKKVGQLLATSILEKAKSLGAKKVVLYSNTKLEAALNLYRKFGFKETPPECGKYGRCDTKMEIEL